MVPTSFSRTGGDGTRRRLWCRLFGVDLVSDVHERACDLGLTIPTGAKRRARIERIREAGLLFVHVPKAAGMSISETLYGDQVKHASIRLQCHLDPELAALPSFAVLRDPAKRFLSAYHYGRAGGTANNDVAEPFRTRYRAFRSIDDALDHVEATANPYAVDHIFRAQSWYVTDRKGRIAVDRLVAMDNIAQLPFLVPGFPAVRLPALNRIGPIDIPQLTAAHRARLRRLYAADYAIWEALAHPEAAREPSPLKVA